VATKSKLQFEKTPLGFRQILSVWDDLILEDKLYFIENIGTYYFSDILLLIKKGINEKMNT